MEHPYKTDVENIHVTVPETANFIGLPVTKDLLINDTFGERREEVFNLTFIPIVHFPRLDQFLGKLEKEISQFPSSINAYGDCDD